MPKIQISLTSLLTSIIVRAHPCAAGATKKQGGQAEQGLGYSRGGFSPKIRVSVDGLSNSRRYLATAGQRHRALYRAPGLGTAGRAGTQPGDAVCFAGGSPAPGAQTPERGYQVVLADEG